MKENRLVLLHFHTFLLSNFCGITIVKAPTGSTGAVAGTTTPGTADRRIATTTTRRTGTTTWAFALRVHDKEFGKAGFSLKNRVYGCGFCA